MKTLTRVLTTYAIVQKSTYVTTLFQRLQRIFEMASRQRSRVEKLIVDSYSEHLLLLPFFDKTPRSRDIDC